MTEVAEEDRGYVCSLSEESLKKAAEELNEDPRQRLSQVDTLRRWIKQQPHLSSHTDTNFLLHFLRGAKFSQLRAREKLEGVMRLKACRMEWFNEVDVMEPSMVKTMNAGIALPLPVKDDEGRQIILERVAQVDPDMDPAFRMRFSNIVMSHIFRDENTQVNGVVTVVDFTGMTRKHLTSIPLSDLKKMSEALQHFPGRMKAFHYYNTGIFLEFTMNIIKQLNNAKFTSRVHTHSTLESLYKEVPMKCLPDEYLPDDYTGPSAGSLDSILDGFKKQIQTSEFRDYLLRRTSSKLGIDEKKRIHNEAASFRKLPVD